MKIDLPANSSSPLQASKQIQSLAGRKPAGVSVVIIEHDLQTGQLLSDWLRSAGGFCLLNCHSTAEDALAALPDEKPAIVLIDLELPGQSALECIRQLKPILKQTQFVVLIAHHDTEHVFNALTAGVTGYVLKQTSGAELLAALQHIHAGGSPINCELATRVLHFFHHQSSEGIEVTAELSPRERRLLQLLSGGSSCHEVADNLRISLPIVSTYIRSIYEKLYLQAGR